MTQIAVSIHCCSRNQKENKALTACVIRFAKLVIFLITSGIVFWRYPTLLHWISGTTRFPLSQLVITGNFYYTTNEDICQAILALGKLDSFIVQDINIVKKQIENIPWIKQVKVHKQWPNVFKVYVVEYIPVARWNRVYLLDDQGKIFNVPTQRIGARDQSIPLLCGVQGSEQEVLAGYNVMHSILMPANFHIKSVSMNSRRSWQLILEDNTRLELGRKDIVKRLQRFVWSYPIILQSVKKEKKQINYVDLRYEFGLAVGWKNLYRVNNSN